MMITIDRIHDGEENWHGFPTMDFRFQNKGNTPAPVWQFALEVIQAEIDRTPALTFQSDVKYGLLLIRGTNHGWGDTQHCSVHLHESLLDLLFSDATRCYQGPFPGGKTQDLFHLSTLTVDPQQLQIVKEHVQAWPCDVLVGGQTPPGSDPISGIRLGRIEVNWRDEGSSPQGETRVHVPFDGEIILTEFGFYKLRNPPATGRMIINDLGLYTQKSPTYGAIIDPSRGSYQQTYPISRTIVPGELACFHLTVGAPMSCHLQMRLKFFLGATHLFESELFDLSIWNPRDSGWRSRYTDEKETLRQFMKYRHPYYLRKDMEAIFPLR